MFERNGKTWYDEADLRSAGFSRIAGIDEAGRGCLAGSVVVACVMLHVNHGISGLKDSKKLSSKKREELYLKIMDRSLSVSITQASNDEIDKVNIFRATEACVYKSVLNMKIVPEFVFIDGQFDLDNLLIPHLCVHGADGAEIYEQTDSGKKTLIGHHYENVAAASIIAKVYRDNIMTTYDGIYPGYDFSSHKGYGTSKHLEAIKSIGISPIHRKTFKGCK